MPATRTLRYALAVFDAGLAFAVLLLGLDAVSDFVRLHGGLIGWGVLVAGIALGLADLCFMIWTLEHYPTIRDSAVFRRRFLLVTGTLLLLLPVVVAGHVLVLMPATREMGLAWTAAVGAADWSAAALGTVLGGICLGTARRRPPRPA